MSRLVFSVPIDMPESADPVRLGVVFCLDAHNEAHLWVEDTSAAVAAFVALAAALRGDVEATAGVRRVAAGVFAALGVDVPTEPGVRK